jgi:hypothetical protein
MGHSTPDAALRYQHATEDRDRVIADALAGMTPPAPIVAIESAKAAQTKKTPDSGTDVARKRPSRPPAQGQ